MKEEKRYPKCGRTEKVKNGFNRGKQRYLCKNCGYNYTGTKKLEPRLHKARNHKILCGGNRF